MAITTANNNPLVLTVDQNTSVRAVFRQVEPIVTVTPQETPILVQPTWRDCVDGVLRDGTPPEGYVQVPFQNNDETCWEPRSVLGFEPSLDDVLTFDWRRGTTTYPEAKSFKVTNPSSALSFNVTITTNSLVTVTPSSFTVAPRSHQTVTVLPTTQLFNALADGITNIGFRMEISEVV